METRPSRFDRPRRGTGSSLPRAALTRRDLLAGTASALGIAVPAANAAERRGKARPKAAETGARTNGTPLPIPPLVEVTPTAPFDLVAEAGRHAFLPDLPVDVLGYGGGYMGPALRLRRGTTAALRLVNRLDRPTNVHWHGLLVDGRFDGGTAPVVAPGETWEARLAVDQPAATLWYHTHVHGRTARDVHDGLAGLLIVEDDVAPTLGLPDGWGIDDIPLVLQDRDFDAAGRPVLPPLAHTLEQGFRGRVPIVNGVADAVARVPERRVRLRLLNAAGARTFRLVFDDHRPFHLIAGDAGFLPAPVQTTFLPLAPGERAEILVDFSIGPAVLLTEPDVRERRRGATVTMLPDVLDGPTRLVAFEPMRDKARAHALPRTLAPLPDLPESTLGIPRRRFELRAAPGLSAAGGVAGHDHAGPADRPLPPPRLTINGRTFASNRIDEDVKLGATEIWEIVCPDMAHPFHIHGAHFRVLGEDGDRPKLWNGGMKDTVRVENSAELLLTFTRPADADAPFLLHCQLLDHADGGMAGTFTVS